MLYYIHIETGDRGLYLCLILSRCAIFGVILWAISLISVGFTMHYCVKRRAFVMRQNKWRYEKICMTLL